MQDEARIVLAQLIQTHGQDLIDDHRRLRSMLADSLPGARREAQRLVAAAEEGIPRQILTAGNDPTGAHRLQLARRLQDERDMTPEAADWTIDSWSGALGVDLGARTAARTGSFGEDPTLTISSGASDDMPPPASRRWVFIGLAAAVVTVVVLGFVFLRPFGGTGTGPSPSPTATSTASQEPSSPTPSPTPAEPTPTPEPTTPLEGMLARLDSDMRRTCVESGNTDIGNVQAQVECEADGMDRLFYMQYETLEEMDDQYDRHVPVTTGEGRCPNDIPSERPWSFTSSQAVERGRFACFLDDQTAWIVWTTNYATILAWGNREDGDMSGLYQAWTEPGVTPGRNQ